MYFIAAEESNNIFQKSTVVNISEDKTLKDLGLAPDTTKENIHKRFLRDYYLGCSLRKFDYCYT